jgi:hypothetical protein
MQPADLFKESVVMHDYVERVVGSLSQSLLDNNHNHQITVAPILLSKHQQT